MVIDTMGFIVREGYAVILVSFLFFCLFVKQLLLYVCYKLSDMVSCFKFAAASPCNKDI